MLFLRHNNSENIMLDSRGKSRFNRHPKRQKKYHRMKKMYLFLFCVIFFSGCDQKQTEILNFNDQIIAEQEAVVKAESTLIVSVNEKKLLEIDSNYQRLYSQIITSENKVKGLVDPDPEIGFKQASLTLFEAYKAQTQSGYKTLVDLSKIPDSLFTPRQAKQFEEVSSNVFIKLNAKVDTFMKTQNKLAEKYKFSFKN
jgi:outer membrane murein-binding lipoprotein Lpp